MEQDQDLRVHVERLAQLGQAAKPPRPLSRRCEPRGWLLKFSLSDSSVCKVVTRGRRVGKAGHSHN
jgi:hypothetical protein